MTFLQVTWFFLVGILLTGFAVLDGFDLGAGFWHLRTKGNEERRTVLNAIGPIWDGNEVWLVTGAGALFAAFPPVYASVFSGFYIAMMLLILCLVTRAVSLEFRSKEKSPTWRSIFDTAFSVSSIGAVLLFGVAMGNILIGIPLNEAGDSSIIFFELLGPYALMIGAVGVAMTAFHGANFIAVKAPGDLENRARTWSFYSGIVYLLLFCVASISTFIFFPNLTSNFLSYPVLFVVPVGVTASIVFSLYKIKQHNNVSAFLLSALSIILLMSVVGASLFPTMLPASNDPSLSLTLANSSSSELTLKVMLGLAILGMPLVIGYTAWAYRKFSGKVDINSPANHY